MINPFSTYSLKEQKKKVSKLIEDISNHQDNKNGDKKLPPHLEQFKKNMEMMELSSLQLPVRSTLSSKMKMRLASFSTPSDDELKKAMNYTKDVQYVSGKSAYEGLTISTDKASAKRHKLNKIDKSYVELNFCSNKNASIVVDDSSAEYYRKIERIKKRKAII